MLHLEKMGKAGRSLLAFVLVACLLVSGMPVRAVENASVKEIILKGTDKVDYFYEGTNLTKFLSDSSMANALKNTYGMKVQKNEDENSLSITAANNGDLLGSVPESYRAFSLKLKPKADVTITGIDATTDNDVVKTQSDRDWLISFNITPFLSAPDGKLTITPTTKTTEYSVTLPALSGTGYHIDNLPTPNDETTNKQFKFDIIVEKGYKFSTFSCSGATGQYKIDEGEKSEDLSGIKDDLANLEARTYHVELNATGPVKVNFGLVKQTYTVTFQSDEGSNYSFSSATTSVEYDGLLIFYVNAKSGYELPDASGFTVSPGDKATVTVQGQLGQGTYLLSGVKGNVTVAVTPKKATHTVTFDVSNASVKIDGQGDAVRTYKVEDGNPVEFTVTANTGYQVSSVTTSDNQTLSSKDGKYKLESVKGDITVHVETTTAEYTATFEDVGSKYNEWTVMVGGKTLTDESNTTPVLHGQSLSFQLTLTKEGVKPPTVTAHRDGSEGDETVAYTVSDGVYTYTIPNVTSKLTIKIVSGGAITYTVRCTAGTGYSFEGSANTTVTHGASYTFTLILADSHSNSTPKAYMNGTEVKLTQDQENKCKYTYQVDSVTENLTFTVDNVTKNTYTVPTPKLSTSEADSPDTTGFSVTLPSSVGYGETVSLTVKLNEGYEVPELSPVALMASVTAGNDPLKLSLVTGDDDAANSELVYTGCSNDKTTYNYRLTVKDAITEINVGNAPQLKQFAITKHDEEAGYTLKITDGTVDNDGKKVEYGKAFTFTVELDTGYRLESVTTGGQTVPNVQGTYTVSNVHAPVDIIVEVETVVLTVTYSNPDLTGNGQSSTETVRYSVTGDDDGNVEKLENGILDLSTPNPTAKAAMLRISGVDVTDCYNFEGWFEESKSTSQAIKELKLGNGQDQQYTLTSHWTPNWEAIFSPQLSLSNLGGEEKVTLRFQLTFEAQSVLDSMKVDTSDVVAGIFYTNADWSDGKFNDGVKQALANAANTNRTATSNFEATTSGPIQLDGGGSGTTTVYTTYYKFDSDYAFGLGKQLYVTADWSNVSNSATRSGAGYVSFKLNGQSDYICELTDAKVFKAGQPAAANAVPEPEQLPMEYVGPEMELATEEYTMQPADALVPPEDKALPVTPPPVDSPALPEIPDVTV